MSNIEKALVSKLVGTTAITNIVSARIYPGKLPQDVTYPALSYSRIGGYHEKAATDPALSRAVFQLSFWATKYDQVRDLAEQVHTALHRFSGTVETVVIQDVYAEAPSDHGWDVNAEIYHRSNDYEIIHEA